MALNSITIDGRIATAIERREFRSVTSAVTFVLRHRRNVHYLVYSSIEDDAAQGLEQLKPEVGEHVVVIGKTHPVENTTLEGNRIPMTVVQMTQVHLPNRTNSKTTRDKITV